MLGKLLRSGGTLWRRVWNSTLKNGAIHANGISYIVINAKYIYYMYIYIYECFTLGPEDCYLDVDHSDSWRDVLYGKPDELIGCMSPPLCLDGGAASTLWHTCFLAVVARFFIFMCVASRIPYVFVAFQNMVLVPSANPGHLRPTKLASGCGNTHQCHGSELGCGLHPTEFMSLIWAL